MRKLTIVGGGLSGLVAAITAAERGTEVELFEARKSLGGRARTKSDDFRANIGVHAFRSDGPEADLTVTLTRCACLDLGLKLRLRDPFVVSDLQYGEWLGTYSKADKTLAPKGHHLI
jgi:phytoene dehydrogenase-like protein